MGVLSRKVVREKCAEMLTTRFVGPGKPLQAVYPYQKATFDSPEDVCVLVITPTMSSRGPASSSARVPTPADQFISLNFHTFVLYERTNDDNVVEWSEQASEDALDLIEKSLTDWLREVSDRSDETDPEWVYAFETATPPIDSAFIEGAEYRHELKTITFLVEDES